ncbi:MAG: endopeptidase La [Deltaproteobacteria bacterium]|nr:endopeptidase La [Deltaproteobacteria bacterium]
MAKFFKISNEPDKGNVCIPLLPLRDIVIFPHSVAPLFVGRSKSINALAAAMNQDKIIFLATQIKADINSPGEKDISLTGTIGRVLQILRLPDGTVKAMVEGDRRAKITRFLSNQEFFKIEAEPVTEVDVSGPEPVAVGRAIKDNFKEYSKLNKNISNDLTNSILGIADLSRLTDAVASHFAFPIDDKLRLLETHAVTDRLNLLLDLMKVEIEILRVDAKVKDRVKDQMATSQKNYYLNEKIRAIKKEMGEQDAPYEELAELEEQIKKTKLPEEAREKVEHEFKKLKLMPPMSAEATVVRVYIDWILSLPWLKTSEVSDDIEKAEAILDEDHYGLKKPKERILEYLAVQLLIKKIKGPILCLVGPPGVGKTSLAKSVARATGRKYIRLSLGGVRDEAEIRGHRRTYIGSMPGKIIQSLKKAGVNNPVMCLDEVDKMSMDFRGDPSAALLEVLDPEQNNSFNDHYLDIDYDLSDILFITTANTLDIPLPLQDRMEIIQLSGYSEYEKYHIADKFLLSKQISVNGLEGKNIRFTPNAVHKIIQRYTREAGVRNLEREIASICRKIARKVVNKNKNCISYKVTANSVVKFLGPPPFKHGEIEKNDQIGMVTGLAWTKVGGELLSIETLIMPGKGELILTGTLGDVMKESARAAVSYVRSRAETLQIDNEFYKKYDIHIHVPEGATPKDGPSAGIAICTSLVSAITKRSACRDLAMTGEITLLGRVLPIGGLKEKILAAHRGRIKKVIIPRENEKDLKDIPANVLRQIEIIFVENMDEVLPHALVISPGDQLFKNSDMNLDIIPDNVEQRTSIN